MVGKQMNERKQSAIVIWRLLDGKPGHEKQSLGLVKAIKDKMICDCYDIPVNPKWYDAVNYIGAIWPQGNNLPLPDFIVGAGHNTHLHMLAAKRAFGGKTIVLMRPSLPMSMFDLALIPEHDQYNGHGSYVETRGVLNTMTAKGEHLQDRALIMIGGASRHFLWDNDQVIKQIETLLAQHPNMHFTITSSRRTPAAFLQILEEKLLENQQGNAAQITIVPAKQTPNGWVEQQLAESAYAWITEDSVSMVYEALTAQVAVGVINVEKKRENRVSNGIKQLIQNNMLVRFDAQGHYKKQQRALVGFREADRCANLILNEWHQMQGVQAQPTVA